MSFLLDTNVVSEWVKPQPHPGVANWLAAIDEDRVFLSVVTLAELRHGIDRLEPGKRRDRLDAWVREELPVRFEKRVLPIDAPISDVWGRIVARSHRTLHAMDAFLAATAEVHDLTLVTRNVSDFEVLGRTLLNPWA